MRNQGQVILALIVILIGVVLLIGNLLEVDVWVFCWPTALIVLGLWLLFRPQLLRSDATARQKLLGSIRREGSWSVSDEEFWIGIGDVRLDLTSAEIPSGETKLRVWNLIGDVRLIVPHDVGVSVSSTAFVADVRLFGQKRDSFFVPVDLVSENYQTAEKRLLLETTSFIGDVQVRRQLDV